MDAVQAKGLAGAHLATALKPNAGSKLNFKTLREFQSVRRSRGLADARPSGECRRRSDPEIPRSGGGVTGGRGMVSRTPSRSVARSGSLDSAIWSSGSG